MIQNYDALKSEPEMLEFWHKHKIYEKAKEQNNDKAKFYFLDGPPYTSGKVHLGTAWNKSLKDSVLRFKRMNGFDVWDRAGYDMHGMPTELAVEKKLNLKHKEDIPVFGVASFVKECREFATTNLEVMNKDFKRIGVWMDFENAYQSITKDFINGEWWLIKQAFERNRLYEGERAMTWCSSCATSLAKHELEYEDVNDNSIFVKFKSMQKDNEFFIIWTTTPWTIPFNMAIVVHPEFDYVKCKVGIETWILAKDLAKKVIEEKAERNFEIIEEFKGKELEGLSYEPPFPKVFPQVTEAKKTQTKIFTVLLSHDDVHLDDGTGIVHFASGCGESDYELCLKNGIKPFNLIDEHGKYPDQPEIFKGLVAKKDDKRFIELMEQNGSLVAQSKINHSYAHCWRCKNPVVYKTTKQWFFKVEDLKDKMRQLNKEVKWVPEFAGSKNFDNWLANLRDNGITRQRYWGTPLPIWKCKGCSEIKVIGSVDELKEAAGKIPDDLHKPWIDEVKIKCHCGNEMERIPDILDVWIDAGSASWNCLYYPKREDLFERFFPADFILEGIDQIRGWFNLLLVASMVSMDRLPFKSVYMHGFINDSQGRKMSKSLGNYILPQEVIMEYGADTLRYYMIGGTSPGVDINYNFDDMKVKHKNLTVLWNVHKYVIDLAQNLKVNPNDLDLEKYTLDAEERYIFSRLNSTIKKVTEAFNEYRLNETPWLIEELFLDLSRTYIQLTRDKSSVGSEEEKKVVLYAAYNVLLDTIKMLAPVVPFISEAIYQNLRNEFKLNEKSVHLLKWPVVDEELISHDLEKAVLFANEITQSGLALREKIQLGVRWPIKELVVALKTKEKVNGIENAVDMIKKQVNVKEVRIVETLPNLKLKVKADYSKIGPDFGDKSPKVIAALTIESPESILRNIGEKGKYEIKVDKDVFTIVKDHLIVTREVPAPYEEGSSKHGFIYLNKERTDELEAEGFAREIMRRVQALRKKAVMQKSDRISLFIKVDDDLKRMLKDWQLMIKEKTGASQFKISELDPSKEHEFISPEKVKGKNFTLYLDRD